MITQKKLNKPNLYLKKALTIEPNNALILRSIGRGFLLEAHFLSGFSRLFVLCQARNNFEKSLAIKPEHTSTLRLLAKLNKTQKKLTDSLAIAPKNAFALRSLEDVPKAKKLRLNPKKQLFEDASIDWV